MTIEVTVAQLIEKLQTLPQDAIVQVGKENHRGYSTRMEYSDIDLDIDVSDFSSEEYQGSTLYGTKLINLVAQ